MDSDKALAPQTQRLFLALWPDDAVRAQLAAHTSQWQWPADCTRYAPADLHVTLHFLGDVASGKLDTLAACAEVPFQAFEWVLDRPGLWHRGLAVLCASEVPTALTRLHAQLGQVLGALDLASDPRSLGGRAFCCVSPALWAPPFTCAERSAAQAPRPYVPHVTLARHAEAAIAPAAVVPVRWQVQGFALVASTGRQDPRYRVLWRSRQGT